MKAPQSMTETDPMDVPTLVTDSAVRELPPSCKLVWLALAQEDDVTQKILVEMTGMSHRTMRSALSRLIDAGVVEKHVNPRDARQSLYSLTE